MTILPRIYRKNFDTALTYQYKFTFWAPLSLLQYSGTNPACRQHLQARASE